MRAKWNTMGGLNINCKKQEVESRSHSYITYLSLCPEHWELTGIHRLLKHMAREARLHLTGISSALGLNKVNKLRKKRRLSITTEMAPHFLYFVDSMIAPGNTYMKTIPQIRGKQNSELLWECLKYAEID
jgi:dihydroorotase-like cyclic amidohydrolase